MAFDVELFQSERCARGVTLGVELTASLETGSTNDDAMEAARAGAPHGSCFVTDSQRRGRGRRGARWLSPPGENLLCSVLLRPRLALEHAGTLTLAVGLAVREVIARRVSADVRVKWPNDVVCNGRKLCGILLESQLDGGRISAIVVGIGLNVATRELPDEIAGRATTLALLGARDLGREALLVELLEALEARVRVHEERGLEAAVDELRAHDALAGRRIRVDGVDGVGAGIASDGALLLRLDDGSIRPIRAGTVELDA
ncbi:MAG: biotin--[acetyl-CoA-carboxylase] ligase [Polyangiaceae bacterium]